jgi:hypothetical protein
MRALLVIGLAMTVVACTEPSAVASPTPHATDVAAASRVPDTTMSPIPTVPPTPTPAPTIGPLPSDLDPAIRSAIEDRRMYRLRFDLDYVLKVASDPKAFDAIGFPIYQEEWDQIGRDQAEQHRIAGIINGYGDWHLEQFGGLYIDREVTPGVVVALFTADLAFNEAAIRKKLGETDLFATRQAKYSESELRRVQERVTQDMDAPWVLAIPAIYSSVGADISDNVVDIGVSSSVPEAVDIIAAHYGLGDRLRIISDGTGSMLIPWGTVVGRVTFRGKPVSIPMTANVSLAWDRPGDGVGSCGGGDVGFGVDRRGHFELPCQIGRRTILVQVPGAGDGEWRTIGQGRVIVREGKTSRLDIKLTELPS